MVILYVLIFAAVLLIGTALFSTYTLRTTHTEIEIKDLPESFDGFRFVHISDLHNASFGKKNGRLVERIKKCNPECVIITGDVAGSSSYKHPEKGSFSPLCKGLSPIPIYASLGNHELRLVYKYPELFKGQVEDIRINVTELLDNSSCRIEKNGEHINLFGLSLEGVRHKGFRPFTIPEGVFDGPLKPIKGEANLLLAHIPQLFPEYARHGFQLVLSGHVHGGIIRLPFLGGLLSPERRFFPKYCYGIYEQNDTKMFISAGLGKALIPFRFLCRPEVAEIVLKKSRS